MSTDTVTMAHGSGRGLSELLASVVLPALGLDRAGSTLEDAAVLDLPGSGRLAFTTDSFVVQPRTFPGGDIGTLAACGTINDLAMMGARPSAMAVSVILEEGLPLAELRAYLVSLREVCDGAGVGIVCGDTKVVDRGKADGVFFTTSGIGIVPAGRDISAANAAVGDVVLVSGPIGLHGIAILAQRKNLGFASEAVSDCAALQGIVEVLLEAAPTTHVLRDATRGGCAAVLNEIAVASGVTVEIDQQTLPVAPVVASACSFLGMEPLSIANEGTFVAVVPADHADRAVAAMRSHPLGSGTATIGTVQKAGRFPVTLRTVIGGLRPVEVPPGQLLPRIC
jgi:hydrogenase expression/formation protein HypE